MFLMAGGKSIDRRYKTVDADHLREPRAIAGGRWPTGQPPTRGERRSTPYIRSVTCHQAAGRLSTRRILSPRVGVFTMRYRGRRPEVTNGTSYRGSACGGRFSGLTYRRQAKT